MAAKDSNAGNSEKPGWRGKKTASGGSAGWRKPAGAKAAGSSESWWRKQKDRSYEQAVRRHRLKTAAWFLLSLGLVIGFLPFHFFYLNFLLAPGAGYAIGEVVSLSVNRKRGTGLAVIAGIAVVISYLVGILCPWGFSFSPLDLLALALGIFVAVTRVR